jgi:lysozyme family protein
MAEGNFDRCLTVTSKWEGGEVNHKDDPGGHTNLGVTQATYNTWRRRWGQPTRSVGKITNAEAARIYREGFWDAVNAELLAAGVDLATFDAGVNSGPSRARGWLMASIGGPDHETVKKLCAKRLGFMRSLRIWESFRRGWSRRVADIQAKGVAWALATVNDNAVVRDQLRDEADEAGKAANRQNGGAGAAGAGGAGSIGLEQAAGLPSWAMWIALAVFGIVALLMIVKAVQKRQQADAYRAEAEALSL